jgi:hypothetical protein
MNAIENILFRLARRVHIIRAPRFGFLEFLACNSTVETFAPARWNALVVQMNSGCKGSISGVNDNSTLTSSGPKEKAA